MGHELITANPKFKKKVYKEFSDKKKDIEDISIAKKVINLINENNITIQDYSKEDFEIIKNIYKSFENLVEKKFTKENFYLIPHEKTEFKNIEKKNIIRYLIYRYKYRIYPEIKKIGEFPPCVQIEPTSICNFRCVMCYQKDPTFNKKKDGFMGAMSLDLFKNIIDQLQGNIEAVTLASRGEPLLNPKINEMIAYIDQKFLGFKLNSNVSVLNEKHIHSLLSSNIQTLVFSIDAADKKNYEQIRVNGKFEKIVSNLELFLKIKNKHYPDSKIITRVSGVAINDKIVDIDKMNKVWGKYVDTVALVNYSPMDDTYNNPINEILDPCLELWRRLFVWWDGTVNVCDVDYKSTLSKWDLKKENIKNIWNSEHYNSLREVHIKKKRSSLEPCTRCIST